MTSKLDRIESRLEDMARDHSDLPLDSVRVTRALIHVTNDLRVRMRAALKPFGLSDWSFRTLIMLPPANGPEHDGISMADLALMTGEAAPNMTRICDELVKAGLAVRRTSTEDRRKVVLARTPRAEALLAVAAPEVWGRLDWVMSVLSHQEKSTLVAMLKRVAERLEIEAGQGANRNTRPDAA